MTFDRMIRVMARREGLSLVQSRGIVTRLFKSIADAARQDERVDIPRFGSFKMKPARTRGNSPDGKTIWVRDPHKTLRFTPSKHVGGPGSSQGIRYEPVVAPDETVVAAVAAF